MRVMRPERDNGVRGNIEEERRKRKEKGKEKGKDKRGKEKIREERKGKNCQVVIYLYSLI